MPKAEDCSNWVAMLVHFPGLTDAAWAESTAQCVPTGADLAHVKALPPKGWRSLSGAQVEGGEVEAPFTPSVIPVLQGRQGVFL